MAKKNKKNKSTEVAEEEAAPVASTEMDWQSILDDLGSESNDPRIYFVKAGRNRMKLVLENPADPKSFFTKVVRNYRGQVSTKFLLRAIVFGKKDEELAVRVVPVGKAVLKGVLNLLAEGYNLLDPQKGLGVTIVRQGQGREGTSYMVMASPEPVAMPKKFTDLTDTLADLSAEIQENDEKRAADDEQNAPKRGTRAGRAASARLGKDEEDDSAW